MSATININTGTSISASAALPATFDSATYLALAWTAIGESVDVSEIAKVWAIISHQSVSRAYPVKRKDTYDIADVTINLAKVSADVGQVIMKTALDAPASYSFNIILPSQEIVYFTGHVTKCGRGSIATGAFDSLSITIAVDPESMVDATVAV